MLRQLCNKDKEIVMEYLVRNQMECTFLIGNVKFYGLENDHNQRRCADYFGYFEEGSLRGVLPFYNLGSCIPHYEVDEAIHAFVPLLCERSFDYFLGMKKIVEPLYELIKDKKVTLNYSSDSYYVNNNFKPFKLKNINFEDSMPLTKEKVDFFIRANLEGFGRNNSYEEAEKSLYSRTPEELFIFGRVGDSFVAQGNIQTTTEYVCQIGAVFTAPEERGHGYCKAVVSEICERILSFGKTPTLIVRKDNIPAVKAYKSLGFSAYDDYLIIHFAV